MKRKPTCSIFLANIFQNIFVIQKNNTFSYSYNGCIPVHLDFIVPVHLEHHTSGSSRPSYLWYIQSFHTSGSSRFHSYIWFIQIFFHTSGSSRTSYFWFIQIFFIPLVHLELHTSGSSRVFLPVSACKLHIRSKFGQI